MHVAMYSPVLPSSGSPNGIVTYVRIMQAALKSLGHRATVFDGHGIEYDDGRVERVARDRSAATQVRRVRERLIGRSPTSWPLTFRHIVTRIHTEHPIDVVEMEESFGYAGRLGLGLPMVARLHGPHVFGKDDPEPPAIARISTARIATERASIERVAGITCPSARLMTATLDHYDLAPRHRRTIYNPIPVARPDKRWSINRCKPRQLLFVGRFDVRKGADILLDAFVDVQRRLPDLSLVMCGPDVGIRDAEGRMIPYQEYAERHLPAEARARIRFAGAVPAETIQRLRLESVLCVSTSRFEVLAYSLTEALAVGMPLLASNTFGIAEIVEDGVEGFLAPIGDPAVVAEAIVAALGDPRRLAAVGVAGLALCERLLVPALIAAETVDFYRSLGCGR